MRLTAPYSGPHRAQKRREPKAQFGVPRSTPNAISEHPAIQAPASAIGLFGRFSGRADRDGALMGGSKGRASKLIFFLTIDNSPALNDPVATQVKTGESMHRNASGSSRPCHRGPSSQDERPRRRFVVSRVVPTRENDTGGETNPVLKCRTESRMHINRPHFCQTGKRHSQETTTATTLKRKVT